MSDTKDMTAIPMLEAMVEMLIRLGLRVESVTSRRELDGALIEETVRVAPPRSSGAAEVA